MQLVQQAENLYKRLSQDEELLRLLFYKAKHSGDNVLDKRIRPDILSSKTELSSGIPEDRRQRAFEIIKDRIKPTNKYKDLEGEIKCRICAYLGDRIKEEKNHLYAKQEIIIDILVHHAYDEVDHRSLKIAEEIQRLLFQERTGFGKNMYESMKRTELVPEYISYRLVYSTGGIN
ncbi:hypothetical protein ACH0BF_02245 [Pseudobacillus sp. 179-B 2D1 NHS]|uniref:hypothetical protein n=1 Tax=Pseudobacillus sp. 179-B 2D1 NHS TaxID=3374292 RepID=UPI003879319B